MVSNAANDCSEDSPLVEDTAAKDRLVAEISKTALGRHLLADLERRNITLAVTSDMSAANTETSSVRGYWDPAKRQIMLSADAPLAKQLHYFAHETRHSAQYEVDMGHPNAAEALHPVNFLLRNRLHEMDADAFAVFFVANHDIENKSAYFEELSRQESAPRLFGAFFVSEQKVDRSRMYREFFDSWEKHGKDMKRATRDAAVALFEEPLINQIYDARCVAQWNERIWPQMIEASKTPDALSAKWLRKVFKRFHDKKVQSPKENLVERAKAYSKIYAGAGSPDYLADINGDAFFDYLAKDARGADRIWNREMPGLIDRFDEASDYYLNKMPKPSAKKKPGRKTPAVKAAA
ncbi:MAG: DUF6782 family putative metallopeptidase [Alphaproteobacteria bacterium]